MRPHFFKRIHLSVVPITVACVFPSLLTSIPSTNCRMRYNCRMQLPLSFHTASYVLCDFDSCCRMWLSLTPIPREKNPQDSPVLHGYSVGMYYSMPVLIELLLQITSGSSSSIYTNSALGTGELDYESVVPMALLHSLVVFGGLSLGAAKMRSVERPRLRN